VRLIAAIPCSLGYEVVRQIKMSAGGFHCLDHESGHPIKASQEWCACICTELIFHDSHVVNKESKSCSKFCS
jgi:hypothetical protein